MPKCLSLNNSINPETSSRLFGLLCAMDNGTSQRDAQVDLKIPRLFHTIWLGSKPLIETLPKRFAVTGPMNEDTGSGLMAEVARRHQAFQIFGSELFYPVPYGHCASDYDLSKAFALHHWAHSWKSA